jgi:O-antigen/teichoic acid export membrane protein
MTRLRHSSWNVASGMAYMVLTVGIGIFTTPWLLRWLGQERYGTWRVMSDAFAYLTLLDLGFGGAVMALLAPALGRRDSTTAGRVIVSSLAVYRMITLAMLAAGVLLVILLPRLIPEMGAREIRLAAAILVLPALWTFANVFRVLAEARQQSYVVTLALMAQYLLITGLSLFAAKMNWKLPGQAGASAIGLFLPAAYLVSTGLRQYPGCASSKSTSPMNSALWKLSWPTLIFNLSGRAGLMSDNIVIGWAIGPAMVAPFYLTQRLAALAQLQLQGIGNGTWAGLVELHAQGDAPTFRARLLELTGLVSGLGLAILGPVAAYNRQFLEHWLGLDSYAGDAVTLLACLNAWLWSIFSLWGWPLSGAGKIAAWAPYSLVFLAVNLGVSIIGALRFGMVGPLLGTLTAFLSVNLWAMPLVLEKCFGVRSGSVLRAAGKPLLCGLPYMGLIWSVAHHYAANGWIELGAELSASVAGGIAVWYFTAVSRDERKVWKARITGLLFENRRAVDPGSVVAG